MTGSSGRFVLFDLDGTLVKPGSPLQRAHMDAMAAAIAAATDNPETFVYRGGELFYREVNLAGFTDAGTVRAALVLAGLSDDEADLRLPRVIADMVERLGRVQFPRAGRAVDLLPGTREVLEGLCDAGIALGMSTGNARAVARWKMSAAGLSDLLHDGGFGDTAVHRDDVARAGVAALATGGTPPRGVLVGDTVRDVTAAHAAGLPCLAVTTGAADAGELLAAGANAVLPGLSDRAVETLVRLCSQADALTHPNGS
ncbi:HAD family hydrolase [Streptomyces sp. NPDC059173]|uniref:HAD family hydrolase n=1 Tax=Streptomyces sp. NPDC059173 TaxID=3346756 RepID=UPI00368662BB